MLAIDVNNGGLQIFSDMILTSLTEAEIVHPSGQVIDQISDVDAAKS